MLAKAAKGLVLCWGRLAMRQVLSSTAHASIVMAGVRLQSQCRLAERILTVTPLVPGGTPSDTPHAMLCPALPHLQLRRVQRRC
jgi:hypothetical protein